MNAAEKVAAYKAELEALRNRAPVVTVYVGGREFPHVYLEGTGDWAGEWTWRLVDDNPHETWFHAQCGALELVYRFSFPETEAADYPDVLNDLFSSWEKSCA